MRLTIEPIVPEFRESLNSLLGPFGLSPEIVEWKYFGRAADGQPKGFIWLHQGQVRGCIGLIPFELITPAGPMPAAWTCDWVVHSPHSNPGIGVMLLYHARRSIDPVFSLGGNDLSQKLVSRIAAHVYRDALVEFYLALRVGGSRWFRAVDRRLHGALTLLDGVAIRAATRGGVGVIEPGVSSRLEPLLHWCTMNGAAPRYDLASLKWRIEWCPALESASCYIRSAEISAGALCWRLKTSVRDWRMALWSRPEAHDETREVLKIAVNHVLREGGHRLIIATSSVDGERIRLLKSAGFIRQPQARPLFVTTSGSGIDQLSGLSLLDSDLSYRF